MHPTAGRVLLSSRDKQLNMCTGASAECTAQQDMYDIDVQDVQHARVRQRVCAAQLLWYSWPSMCRVQKARRCGSACMIDNRRPCAQCAWQQPYCVCTSSQVPRAELLLEGRQDCKRSAQGREGPFCNPERRHPIGF